MAGKIEHVIVLMMENRSFDHMFGYLDHPNPEFPRLTGNEQSDGFKVNSAAYYEVNSPDHTHRGVMQQIYGADRYDKTWSPKPPYPTQNTNRGFVQNYAYSIGGTREQGAAIMRCFHPSKIPVMAGLAREYAIYTRWFCSVPGPSSTPRRRTRRTSCGSTTSCAPTGCGSRSTRTRCSGPRGCCR